MQFHLTFSIMLLLGTGLIVLGGWLLLRKRKHRESGAMKIRTPLMSFEFTGEGASGIACIVVGVILLGFAADLAIHGGQDRQGSSALALVPTAVAEEHKWKQKGWVYVPEGSFTGLQGSSIGERIMQAQRQSVPLRESYFDDFTGTLVGRLLGYAEPDVVGQVTHGNCVKVEEDRTVGFGKVWMKVEKVECP